MSADKKKRGFAGLEAMVSEVGTLKAPSEHPTFRAESSQTPELKPQETGQNNPESSGASSGFGVVLLVVGLVVVYIILIANSGSGPPAGPNHSATQTSVPAPSPTYAPDPSPPRPSTSTPQYSANDEERPPIGSGLLLGRAQMRYCQSQKIRLSAWEGAANKFSKAAVDAFNAAVDDYNARCSNFRYTSGMLESVRVEVEANRSQLMVEGTALASTNP
jgi:hypothetical protein